MLNSVRSSSRSPSPLPMSSPYSPSDLSSFDSPSTDYANSLFSPPLTKSSQLSFNTTVLAADSAVSSSNAKPTFSTITMDQSSSAHRKRPGPGVGAHGRKGVNIFSPMLEEDEEGVFSSPRRPTPPSTTSRQHSSDPVRSETPPLRFTPRRPSETSLNGVVVAAAQAGGSLSVSNANAPQHRTVSQPSASNTAHLISQFENRQPPQATRSPTTAFSKSQLDKPLPPVSPHFQPQSQIQQHQPTTPSSAYLPAPPSPQFYVHQQAGSSPTKRSPLRDGLKSLVKKFGHVKTPSSGTSPSKFRFGVGGAKRNGSESPTSVVVRDFADRRTPLGGVSWEDRRGESTGAEEEILGSEVGQGGGSGVWDYPRSSSFDPRPTEVQTDADEQDEPYSLGNSGVASPVQKSVGSPSLAMAPKPSPQASRPLPPQPTHSHTSQPSTYSTYSTMSGQILRQGPLLLFSPDSSPPHWIRTTATLSGSLLSFQFSSLRGSVENVNHPLPGDSIVRSVPEREASGRWPVPFGDDDEGEVHYLEIGIQGPEGKRAVVIAVRSIGERLGWVGSIWDAILAGVMSPDPEGSQVMSFFPAPPTTIPPSPLAAPLPPIAVDDDTHPRHDSPQESLLTTPPLSPARRAAGHGSYDTAEIISSAVTTDDTDHDRARIQESTDSNHSDGPPRLVLPTSKPLDLLRRGSGEDDDSSLRFNVEQMFLTSGFSTYTPPPPSPSPRKSTNVTALASAYESHTNSLNSVRGEKGVWSKASSVAGEKVEGPSSLDNFDDHTRAAKMRSQAHHRHSKSNPPFSSPKRDGVQAQPYYFSTRPGTSPSSGPMGRSRSDSLPLTSQPLFSPGGKSEYYLQDFDESDLNPSRSASQVQRRNTRNSRLAGAALPVQEQYADVPTPRQSVLFETTTGQGSLAPVPESGRTTPPNASADLTSILQLLSAQAASSSSRSELTDLKLASVQEGVGSLIVQSSVEEVKLAEMLKGLQGVEEGMKEVALGVTGTLDDRSALQGTVNEVNDKLSLVLALCEKFGAAGPSSTSTLTPVTDGSGPSVGGKEGTATRPLPPPVLPIVGVPGGVDGRLPDDAFDSGDSVGRSLVGGETIDNTPDTNAATENVHLGTISTSLSADTSTVVDPRIDEVLQLIKTQHIGRTAQGQQTSDIARYLNELNRWMEEFVRNGHSSIDALSGRVAHIQDLIEPPPAATPHLGQEPTPMPVGVVGQIASLRDMVEAVRDRLDRESDGDVNQQRLESLLGSVEMERQRYQQQNSSIENVVSLLDRQRLENQELLKAMVHDLKSEIQGERIRFVDAMRSATQINIENHLEKFKQQLSAEVSRSLHDLHRMREEKKVLEGQIAELFAFKVKNGETLRLPTSSTPERRPSYPVGAGPSPFPSPSVPLPPVPSHRTSYQL